jgi:geranylgeranyl diphosphate synthase type II
MGAVQRVKDLVAAAVEAVPVCAGAGSLRMLIQAESQRILPRDLARLAA